MSKVKLKKALRTRNRNTKVATPTGRFANRGGHKTQTNRLPRLANLPVHENVALLRFY
jgi:hypothetical protein